MSIVYQDFTASPFAAGVLTTQGSWATGLVAYSPLTVGADGLTDPNDGSDNLLAVPNFSQSAPWAVTAAIKGSTSYPYYVAIYLYDSALQSAAVVLDIVPSSSTIEISNADSGDTGQVPITDPPADYLLTFNYDGTKLNVLINGVIVGSLTGGSGLANVAYLDLDLADFESVGIAIQNLMLPTPLATPFTLDGTNYVNPCSLNPATVLLVKSGTDFIDQTGTARVGTYDPITGNYTDPGIAKVKSGTTYKFAGSTLTGTLASGGGGGLRQRGRF